MFLVDQKYISIEIISFFYRYRN